MVEERQPVGYLALEIAYEVNFGGRTVRRREQSQLRVQVTHQTRNCTPGLFDRQPCSVLSEITERCRQRFGCLTHKTLLSRRAQSSLQFGRVLVRNRRFQDFAAYSVQLF